MQQWLQSLQAQLAAWSPARRAAFVATAVGSLAFFLWIAFGTASTQYALLYRGLAGDEMAEVVKALDAERAVYRLTEGGASIEVAAEQVYAMRIQLAGQGLPRGGGAGFELFDKSDFGVTDFVHRVNYRRALQGELARSIAELEPVSRARVQIAMPERSVFVGDAERRPSASVVVDLRGGQELSAEQVRGIVHLVSASVESLSAQRVTVVDGRGRLLAPVGESVDPAQPNGTGSYQERLERELGQRIESILGHTVGAGRVVARVRADLDWTQTEQTEERFDPDQQVERSVQKSTEIDESGQRGAAAGMPGVASNLPGGAGGAIQGDGGSSQKSSRTSETTNYEIGKTVRRSVGSAGTVKRLTVAILLDGKPAAPAAGDGEAPKAEFQPWSAEELADFEQLAKRAVGFSDQRGDQLTITNAPFRALDAEQEDAPWFGPSTSALLGPALRGVLLLLALVAFGLLVVRPLAGALAAQPAQMPMRVADLEAQLAGGGGAVGVATAAAEPA
ncbi:MAG: flagellar M-ring protein FliF, partial [Proteobacteria bacterium]